MLAPDITVSREAGRLWRPWSPPLAKGPGLAFQTCTWQWNWNLESETVGWFQGRAGGVQGSGDCVWAKLSGQGCSYLRAWGRASSTIQAAGIVKGK